MIVNSVGEVPVHWWTHAVNFGDCLAPWLVEKISGREVAYAEKNENSYVVIGSILGHAGSNNIVWGAGSFGTELAGSPRRLKQEVKKPAFIAADFRAVRGPLTRNKIVTWGGECPRVYGDPGLLVSHFFNPPVEKQYEIGLVLRWSDAKKIRNLNIPEVKVIDLKTDDIEGVLKEVLSCKRIISSSLHGLVVADAYGIPSAWLDSSTPVGLEFKFWDYMIAVNKLRRPVNVSILDVLRRCGYEKVIDICEFDERDIDFDSKLFLETCPFKP